MRRFDGRSKTCSIGAAVAVALASTACVGPKASSNSSSDTLTQVTSDTIAAPPVIGAESAPTPESAETLAVDMNSDSAIATIGVPIPAPEPWSSVIAATLVRRLPPRAFAALPDQLRRVLEAKRCRVPQTWLGWREEPNNVISGSFTRAGQLDWAALCSDGESSQIVVLWGGTVGCDSAPTAVPDKHSTSTMDGEVAFAATILVFDLAPIAQGRAGWPPHGIEYVYEGRASVIYACRGGRWQAISGAD